MSVFSAPPILTLHLKRFNFRGKKINKRVNFDDSLDLKPAMSNDSDPIGYKLYAVVCHRGQSNKSGHYYAHVKASNGKWYVADDSTIESIPDSRAVLANEHAYILFYARDRESLLSAAIAGNRQPTSTTSLDGSNRGPLFKRKPSISNDSHLNYSVAQEVSENTGRSPSQSENTRKRVRTGSTSCNESPPKQFLGPVIPRPLLPSFKFNETKPCASNALPTSPIKPNPVCEQDAQQAGGGSAPSHSNPPNLAKSQQGQLSEDEVEQPMNQMKKKKRNRKPKSKHCKLVNITGTQVNQVSSYRPRLITG